MGKNMTLKAFWGLVEIQTKLASLIPFVFGTLFVLYRYDSLDYINLGIMFVSMITFDMATTAINNYCDYTNELKTHGSEFLSNNPIIKHGIRKKTALITIYILLMVAIIAGITLTLRTNIFVLIIGVICFVVGILYTYGPIPISRMPLGEILSGLFMGFVLTFLSVYIHIFKTSNILLFFYKSPLVHVATNILEVLVVCLVSIPLVTGIANIMLANNICDVDEDVKINRFTLPYYIGKKNALQLFRISYYIGFVAIGYGVLIRLLPVVTLITFITAIPLNRNLKAFDKLQDKVKTFPLAVKNFMLINGAYILTMIVGVMGKILFK